MKAIMKLYRGDRKSDSSLQCYVGCTQRYSFLKSYSSKMIGKLKRLQNDQNIYQTIQGIEHSHPCNDFFRLWKRPFFPSALNHTSAQISTPLAS